jgi:CSLREA domain-containing protein
MRIGDRRLFVALAISLVFTFAGALPAVAATFTVNSTADAVDANLADGVCETATAGVCTLRAAIQQANASAGTDTIVLPAGTYTLTIAGAGEDAAVTGDLDVTGILTITGAGADTTIVEACAIPPLATTCTGIDRVFEVRPGARVPPVSLSAGATRQP